MALIILLRHGQARNNVERILAGRTQGFDLTGAGAGQARSAGLMLQKSQIRRIYSSPVARARQTAEIVAGMVPSEVANDERLIEIEMGRLTGMEYGDVESKYGSIFAGFYRGDPAVVENGVEPFSEVRRRMGDMTKYVMERHNDENVLLVTHMDPIKAMLANVTGMPPGSLARLVIANCSLTVFGHCDGDVYLMGVNVMGMERYTQGW